MPGYFTLTKKGETAPSRFADIDDAMCAHFGVAPHKTDYYQAWYDIEGLGLAVGLTWEKMREINPERKPIIDWLEENYLPDAWHARG